MFFLNIIRHINNAVPHILWVGVETDIIFLKVDLVVYVYANHCNSKNQEIESILMTEKALCTKIFNEILLLILNVGNKLNVQHYRR